MTKMNRRDYLMGMGLAAGAFASWPTLDVLGKREISEWSTANHKLGQTAPLTGLLHWIPTDMRPDPNAFVTAIFWGLMGFCYKTASGAPVFEVGFHPGGNHHKLSVTALEINQSDPEVKCSWHPSKKDTMTLKVTGRGDPPKVYQKAGEFNRITGDEYDFRWLPDLDSRGFYPDPVAKNKHFGARLEVANGVLYTRKRTDSTFNLVKANDPAQIIDPFGHVAMFMAVAIGVNNATDSVLLEMDGESPCRLEQKPNTRYQIIFKNECTHSSCPGPATSSSPNEELRNHFHFMRKVLKLSDDRLKYSLMVDQPARPGAKPDFHDPDDLKAKQDQKFVTDEAPCMGAAFGQTNGFPT